MAVTTEQSTQLANRVGSASAPPVPNKVYEVGGTLRWSKYDFTQGALAGDANSTMDLVKIPAGTSMIIKTLSRVKFSAFGAARLLDIGHTGYTKADGTVVAASVDVIEDGRDVSSAGQVFLGVGTNAAPTEFFEIDAKEELLIQAKVLVDTIPAAATLNGWICFVHN